MELRVCSRDLRVGSLALRVVRLAESNLQMDLRVVQRSSWLVLKNESVFSMYQAVVLDEPSLGSMSESRCSMPLRVWLDDEGGFVEKQCVVEMDEAVISMDL
jgi:hypothetical protein